MNTYGAQDPAFDEPRREEDPDEVYERWAQDELDGLFKEPAQPRKPMNREVIKALDEEERQDAGGSGA